MAEGNVSTMSRVSTGDHEASSSSIQQDPAEDPSTTKSLPRSQKINEKVEDKDLFVVAYLDEGENKQYLMKVSEVWINFAENTVSIPPTKALRKKSTLIRRTPPDESWLDYKIIDQHGPYSYTEAIKKERELSAGESESDSKKPEIRKKRKKCPKALRLPGENSSSDENESDSCESDPPLEKISKSSLSPAGKIISSKSSPIRDSGFIEQDEEDDENSDAVPVINKPKRHVKSSAEALANRKSDNKQNREIVLDQSFASQFQVTQNAIVKELQMMRAENRSSREQRDDEDEENDPLPTFPLKTLKAALEFNALLKDRNQGPEIDRLLVSRLKKYAGDNVSEYVLNILDYILAENVIEEFSWSGKNTEKRKFKENQICQAMIKTVMCSFGTKKQVEECIKSKLQHAEERHNKRAEARKKDEALDKAIMDATMDATEE